MASACSVMTAPFAPPSASPSLSITASGVFKACARLPTCVRERSTMRRLFSMSAFISLASGAISGGNSPSRRWDFPSRIFCKDWLTACSGRRPRRVTNALIEITPIQNNERYRFNRREKASISCQTSLLLPMTRKRATCDLSSNVCSVSMTSSVSPMSPGAS